MKKTPAKKKAAMWWVARDACGTYLLSRERPRYDGSMWETKRPYLTLSESEAANFDAPVLPPGAGPIRVRIRIEACDE